ncbi:MAG: EamA family transporter [Candidatus Omnitrophica bacterium]|nr:EamA family transporter [Candidatus Omnitrophota bacterium]
MTAKKRLTFKILLFLVSTDILETFAQFCFKKSAACQNFPEVVTFMQGIVFLKSAFLSPFLWLALLSVFFIFVIWSTILSKIDLSVAVPVASFSYVLVPLVSSIFLHEKISHIRWLGIIFILIGVIFVSMSTSRREEKV